MGKSVLFFDEDIEQENFVFFFLRTTIFCGVVL